MTKNEQSIKHDQRVLFVHGLESTPYGYKYQFLKKKFKHVHSVSMHTGILNCKKNSFLMAALRESSLHKLLANLLLFLYFDYYVLQDIGKGHSWTFYLSVISLIFFWVRKDSMMREVRGDTILSILNNCMEIQTKVIKQFEPDVIVASSFGAAVVVFGTLEQRFKAPIVLCASAHEKAHQEMFDYWIESKKDKDGKKGLKIPSDVPAIIIHGANDYTVPVEHSRRLYEILQADKARKDLKTLTKYHEIPDEEHRLRSILSMSSSIKKGQTLLETSVLECITNKSL